MVRGQGDQNGCMPGFDREDDEAVVEDRFLDEVVVTLGQGILAQADLDGQFPVARRTDQLGVGCIFDEGPSSSAQLRVAFRDTGYERGPNSTFTDCPDSIAGKGLNRIQFP